MLMIAAPAPRTPTLRAQQMSVFTVPACRALAVQARPIGSCRARRRVLPLCKLDHFGYRLAGVTACVLNDLDPSAIDAPDVIAGPV